MYHKKTFKNYDLTHFEIQILSHHYLALLISELSYTPIQFCKTLFNIIF